MPFPVPSNLPHHGNSLRYRQDALLGQKNSPENCLVDLGRDTRTSTQSRRLVRRKGASWSLNWPSGANSLAHLQLKCILYVPL